MKIRLCLMAGILGIAVVAGVLESLSTQRNDKKQQEEERSRDNR